MSKLNADKSDRPPPRSDRVGREAAALRANLLKRKDQARQREEAKAKHEPHSD